jgi:outer membrane protein assembly factor BamB
MSALLLFQGGVVSEDPTLFKKVKVGCQHWGPGCWVPGFQGTDSSPMLLPDESLVLIGSYDTNMYGVNTKDGTIAWKSPGNGGEGSASVLADGSSVMWGNIWSDNLVRLDASGKTLWTWVPPVKGGITTCGADESNNIAFAGTEDTNLFYGIDLTTGTTKWTYNAGGGMWGTLGTLNVPRSVSGLDSDMVCVGVGGNGNPFLDCKAAVHCLRPDGTLVWKAPTGKQIQSRPTLGKSLMFIGDYGKTSHALCVLFRAIAIHPNDNSILSYPLCR